MWDYWLMSTTRWRIITTRCRLHGTSTTAFHRLSSLIDTCIKSIRHTYTDGWQSAESYENFMSQTHTVSCQSFETYRAHWGSERPSWSPDFLHVTDCPVSYSDTSYELCDVTGHRFPTHTSVLWQNNWSLVVFIQSSTFSSISKMAKV